MELKDLRESAALARINMSEDELKEVYPAFEQTLSFFTIMGDSGVGDTPPASAEQTEGLIAPAKNVASGWLRPDTVTAAEDGVFESMLSQSPEHDGRFIVIPNVL